MLKIMARRREVVEEDHENELDLEQEVEEEEEEDYHGKSGRRKRSRSEFIHGSLIESDAEDEDDEDERGEKKKKKKKSGLSEIFDLEAIVQSAEEDGEENDAEDDFINDAGAEMDGDDGGRRQQQPTNIIAEDQEDVEEMEQRVYESHSNHVEFTEDATEVDQQAFLPYIGHECETAISLTQKCMDRPGLQIRSVVALDHLKNYVYVEADKEAHVQEATKGMCNILSTAKIILVPIKEMTDVLSVESKSVDLARDSWVRMKLGIYKGDLAKVVDVGYVRQKVTIKLVPRVDLQHIASKLEGRGVPIKKACVPPPRFFNVDEARKMHIRVEKRMDRDTGATFEFVDSMMFRDGFLYKTVSLKSVNTNAIQPSFDELEKFQKPGEDTDGDMTSLSTLLANRKKGHFMKGDAAIVVKGDLKNLMGWVKKVEEETVLIKPKMKESRRILTFNEKELCKYFKPGEHVKVVSGVQEGATGMVVEVEGHVLTILSNTAKEDIQVFADNVVKSSEVTSGKTSFEGFKLQDLVLTDNSTFGVIIRMENDVFQVLKGIPDWPEVALIKLKEIKRKIDGQSNVQDRYRNHISAKDIVLVLEGPHKGKPGVVRHIYRGVIFIHDRNHLEDAGFICVKAQSCMLLAGNHERNSLNPFDSRMNEQEFGERFRGGRGYDSSVGKTIKIRLGPWKGHHGCVIDVTRGYVRVDLEAQMRVVNVDKKDIDDGSATAYPYPLRESTLHGTGNETPMHPSRSPMHYQTPMRDPGATPIQDGMVTPMVKTAWAAMSPPRNCWEDGNPGSWGANPQCQPTPTVRPYEAPTHGLGDGDGNWLLTDIYVNVVRPGEEPVLGVISEVNTDGSCRVALGGGDGDEMETLLLGEMEPVRPKKSDRIRIIGGAQRGLSGKLMGVDEDDGIVKLDGTYDFKILLMSSLAKLAT